VETVQALRRDTANRKGGAAMSNDKRKGGRRRQFEPLAAVKLHIYVPEGMEQECIEAAKAKVQEVFNDRKEGKG
jgi:hypothetical protein